MYVELIESMRDDPRRTIGRVLRHPRFEARMLRHEAQRVLENGLHTWVPRLPVTLRYFAVIHAACLAAGNDNPAEVRAIDMLKALKPGEPAHA